MRGSKRPRQGRRGPGPEHLGRAAPTLAAAAPSRAAGAKGVPQAAARRLSSEAQPLSACGVHLWGSPRGRADPRLLPSPRSAAATQSVPRSVHGAVRQGRRAAWQPAGGPHGARGAGAVAGWGRGRGGRVGPVGSRESCGQLGRARKEAAGDLRGPCASPRPAAPPPRSAPLRPQVWDMCIGAAAGVSATLVSMPFGEPGG
jgi:hypothetical protein